MNKARVTAKWIAGVMAAAALVVGATIAPAQAADKSSDQADRSNSASFSQLRDTGW
jgi:hypothetical protein